MRRFLSKKILVAFVLCSMGVFLFVPQTSYAIDAIDVAAKVANTFYGSLGKALYEGLQTPLSWILSLAGQILDFTITLSLSATDLFNSPAVNIGWKAVRDIFNMFFIFSLIYISIKTILKSGGYKTSDALKNVIIGAVLINFSLYFTKIVIDISNVFAVWIYNGIQGLTPGGGGGISRTIQDIFSFEKMFQTREVNDLSAFVAVFALIFLYAASIKIFLEVSFLFITRTVMFVFLLILSPIGFVGEVFPKLASESERWKKDLTGQALVAPVFLLLLYITLLFVDNIQATTLFLNKPAIDSTTKSSFTFVDFALFMITYFMIKKSLDVAKDFSGKSGDMITGAIKGGLGIALGAATGGVALAGRIGAAAAFAEKGKGAAAALTTFRAATPVLNKIGTGKSFIKDVSKGLKEGSYDIRNIPLPGDQKSVGNLLSETLPSIKFAQRSAKDHKDDVKQMADSINLQEKTLSVLKEIENIEKAHGDFASGAITHPQLNTLRRDSQSAIKKITARMSDKELESLTEKAHKAAEEYAKNSTIGRTTENILAGYSETVTHPKSKKILESELSKKIKDSFANSRLQEISYALASTGPTRADDIKNAFSKLSPSDIARLPMNRTGLEDQDLMSLLKIEHLKTIMESYTWDERTLIRDYISTRPVAPGSNDSVKKWLNENSEGQLF